MSVIDLFSRRQKREKGEVQDVFRYDVVPDELRVQVVHIIKDVVGDPTSSAPYQAYGRIHDALAREKGCFNLSNKSTPVQNLFDYILQSNAESALDAIQLVFQMVERLDSSHRHYSRMTPGEAIHELNARLLLHGLGYEYVSRQLVRKDSQFLHAEVVKPSLGLLEARGYEGAHEEFMKAFEHHRLGNTKECLNECLKSFESTLKAICKKRNWAYQQTDTAKTLIDIVVAQGLLPAYLVSHFTGIRACLESGVPTVRNKVSGHGQGPSPVIVPSHYASYMLHLTATSIQFLIQSEKQP